jgi:hypothetical protein
MHVARRETSDQSDQTKDEALGGDRGRVALVRIAAAHLPDRRSLVCALVALAPAHNITQFITGSRYHSGKCRLYTVVDVGCATGFRVIVTDAAVAHSFGRHGGCQAGKGENCQHDSVHFLHE